MTVSDELWKVIASIPEYSVSTLGRIRRDSTGRIRKHTVSTHGYLTFTLRGKHYFVHRLVAEAFVLREEGCNCVDHLDGDPKNPIYTNLRWTTTSGNHRNRHVVLSATGVVGVSASGRPSFPWLAYGKLHRRFINLGRYKTKEEAHSARLTWESENGFTTSANLGFPAHGTKKRVIDIKLSKEG